MEKQLYLSLAATKRIYDIAAVEKALAQMDVKENPALVRAYRKMVEKGADRYLMKPTSISALDWLYEACPNFSPVLDDLKKYLHLAIFGNGLLNFMPIMLAGDPGVGKTHFAECLADALGTEFCNVSMQNVTAGWVLSGAAPTWSGAKMGKVASKLLEGPLANPVFLCDELDKAGGQQFPASAPLYDLLEPRTNHRFVDEFLDLTVDASALTWVATANDLTKIDSTLLDRFAIYEVRPPTADESRRIGQALYKRLMSMNGWAFEPELSDNALNAIAGIPPRSMRKRITDAMGTALVAGRQHVIADDFHTSNVAKKNKSMGFLANVA